MLKLMTVPLTHRRSNCAKASLYKKMTPQLLNVKLSGSPKRKAYSYIQCSYMYIDQESELKKTYARASCASTACIVRTYMYKDSFRVEYRLGVLHKHPLPCPYLDMIWCTTQLIT